MTKEHIKKLLKYRIDQSQLHRQAILDAIIQLINPLPHQIKKFLDEKALKEAEEKYHKGEILKSQILKEAKKLTVDIRTVHRKLATLTEEGLLEHKDNRYSLSSKALSDIRYFPQGFGELALNHVCHFPVRSVDQSLNEFITRFGLFIVFAFIEAARPTKDKTIDTADKDRLLQSWLNDAIPVRSMFDLFTTLYIDNNKSSKELNQKTIEKLTKILANNYSDVYQELLEARSRATQKPTTWIVGHAFAYVVPKDWYEQIK